MKYKKIDENLGSISFSKKEVDYIAKSTFYIQKFNKKKGPLFESLVDFLLDIRNSFLQFAE